jgi:predicted permease
MFPFANADQPDTSDASIALIVVSAGIILLAAAAAFIPVAIARRRRHRQSETIVPLSIVWALATVAVSIYAYISQTRWTREYTLRIESGYFDPQDKSGAPALPWLLWGVLAAIYLLLIALAALARESGEVDSRK